MKHDKATASSLSPSLSPAAPTSHHDCDTPRVLYTPSLFTLCTSLTMHWYISLPVTIIIVVRAYRRKSLTTLGCITAGASALIHAAHPSALPFTLLFVFFVLGTSATKVKHDIKASLTLSSSGKSGGEGARTSVQVLANSGVASILCLAHVWKFGWGTGLTCFGPAGGMGTGSDEAVSSLLLVGIVANYASVTADTMSSELGILSKRQPVLITKIWKKVPKGSNGGITLDGVVWGWLGSAVIAVVSVVMLPLCGTEEGWTEWAKGLIGQSQGTVWTMRDKAVLVGIFSLWGAMGSLLDSFLGALLQASVVDRRTGKVVEGPGGTKVLTHADPSIPGNQQGGTKKQESRIINSGSDLLDNNGINLLMAASMTIWGMAFAAAVSGGRIDSR